MNRPEAASHMGSRPKRVKMCCPNNFVTLPATVLTVEWAFLNRKNRRLPHGGPADAGERQSPWRPRNHVAQQEDVAMRTNLNFSPLFRSTIGFDRVFDLLENASRMQSFESWPPYDIVRASEDSYRITMAVAGF